jgi:Virulence factor
VPELKSVQKILVYWRDIPAQVIVKAGRKRAKAELSTRFMESIDRAAMRAGKGSSSAYMEDWRRETSRVESCEDMQAFADAEAHELEQRYTQEDLDALIRSKGLAET